jgi:hypothetical protein
MNTYFNLSNILINIILTTISHSANLINVIPSKLLGIGGLKYETVN